MSRIIYRRQLYIIATDAAFAFWSFFFNLTSANNTVLYMVRTLSGNLVKFKILKRSLNIDTRKCELIYKNCLQKINLKTVVTLHSCFGD